MYIAQFTPEAVEDIRKLPKNVRNALQKKFRDTILKDPAGCSDALTEPLESFRSFHFGKYRVVYRIYADWNAIAVVGIGKKSGRHQSDVYKKLAVLAGTGKLADTILKTLRLFSAP